MINYLVLSDIHLGHNKNKAVEIVENLKDYFYVNDKKFRNLDVIFLAGDVFDKLLTTNSASYKVSVQWLTWLALYCSKNNIKLRILEGTPSHDWKQSSLIDNVLKEIKISLDYKYIDVLSIEKMEDIDLSILYVPDEWKHNANETYEDIKKLLNDNHLEQVDIAIMHGQFHYQIPVITLDSSHNEIDFLKLVKHYISIGHIHTHSVRGRIIAQGSFDRLAQNEEEPKGGVLITLDKTLGDRYEFIVNKNSKIFKTIYSNATDLNTLVKELTSKLKKIKEFSFIRIKVGNETNLVKHEKDVNKIFFNYHIVIENKDKHDKKKILKLVTAKINDSFKIDKNNIKDLMEKEMLKHNLKDSDMVMFEEELDSSLENIE